MHPDWNMTKWPRMWFYIFLGKKKSALLAKAIYNNFVHHCLVDWPEFESASFSFSFHITYHYSIWNINNYQLILHDFALLTEIKKLLSPSFSIIYMIKFFSKSNNTIILEFIIIL